MEEMKKNSFNHSYLAFDILPMSSPSRNEGVRLAAVVKLTDGTIKEYNNVNRNKLLSIIKQYSPNFVGTDNPSEILKPKESISSFCSKLPVLSNFVHVNRNDQGVQIPLKNLLTHYNFTKPNKKLNPHETAHALIKLMENGVGMIFEPFENETIIDIARPRRRGKGGWSQSRYERQGEEIVSRATKQLKEMLDKNDLQYDLISTSTKYGAKQSRFHLFENKETVLLNIKTSSLFPAKIKIWSPKKVIITHRPIKTRIDRINSHIYNNHQRLIVGIDPGITTGVAIVSLSGQIKSIYSRKNMSRGKLIGDLSSYGSPIAVCADVSPVPQFVNKIAATYNAQLFSPRNQLNQNEKRKLVSKFLPDNKLNSHERDALSAVLHMLNRYKQIFQKIDGMNFNSFENETAKGLIIRGLSITDAVAAIEILKKPQDYKHEFTLSQEENEENLSGRLYNILGDLGRSEETISNLRSHLTKQEVVIQNQAKEIKKLRSKLNKIKDEDTLNILKSEIVEQKDNQIKHITKRLQKELKTNHTLISRIRDLESLLWLTLDSDKLPIKVLPLFSKSAIYKLQMETHVQDEDILLILDPTGGSQQTAKNLAKTKFKIIFLEGKKMPTEAARIMEEKGIPVVYSKDYNVKRINQYAIISINELNLAINTYNEEYRNRQERKRTKMIDLTIENYQFEREKQLLDISSNYDDYDPTETKNADLAD